MIRKHRGRELFMAKLKETIRRYLPVSAMIDTLLRGEIALLNPQNWDDRNDINFMQLYKTHKNLSSLYAMCAAQCSETYAHWRVYTPAAEGACIVISRKPFEDLLTSRGFRYGPVKYLILNEVKKLGPPDVERLPFCKRKGFGAEEEYRVIASSPASQAAALSLAIERSCIRKIELNPWMPEPLADSLMKTISSIPGCENIQTSQSNLTNNQDWRNAGNRVVGRQPEQPLTTV
jgi:hypothetical protein